MPHFCNQTLEGTCRVSSLFFVYTTSYRLERACYNTGIGVPLWLSALKDESTRIKFIGVGFCVDTNLIRKFSPEYSDPLQTRLPLTCAYSALTKHFTVNRIFVSPRPVACTTFGWGWSWCWIHARATLGYFTKIWTSPWAARDATPFPFCGK